MSFDKLGKYKDAINKISINEINKNKRADLFLLQNKKWSKLYNRCRRKRILHDSLRSIYKKGLKGNSKVANVLGKMRCVFLKKR